MNGIIAEKIQFSSGLLTLSGVLEYPEESPIQYGSLLCSPHPHFAGNMDNNVVAAISKTFAQDSVVLRFDYRGVGQSRIDLPEGTSVFDYWDDVEATKDYSDATEDIDAAFETLLKSLDGDLSIKRTLVGYSFGAAVAMRYGMENEQADVLVGIAPPLGKVDFTFLSRCKKPCLLLMGKEDFLYSNDKLEKLRKAVTETVTIEVLEGCDHFFREDEATIAQLVHEFISKHTYMETS